MKDLKSLFVMIFFTYGSIRKGYIGFYDLKDRIVKVCLCHPLSIQMCSFPILL